MKPISMNSSLHFLTYPVLYFKTVIQNLSFEIVDFLVNINFAKVSDVPYFYVVYILYIDKEKFGLLMSRKRETL